MNDNYQTITEFTRKLKLKFDNDLELKYVFLKGEISNFKAHSRGHYYFSLKDDNAKINAIMFSFQTRNINFLPKDGMKVFVEGKISVYEASGSYQIYVEKMYEDGVGDLYKKYEELKKKLANLGVFDDKYKKPIPKYPTNIGVITAPTGAAIRDILSTIKRRYNICNTYLFPALVQGDGAKESIVKQIKNAEKNNLDVIILGRGGGSIEDLWAFNEEIVARAIFDCKIPIISAVGHEVDFTIADFVADLRAPTPTGAAEMAVPNINDVRFHIETLENMLNKNIYNLFKSKQEKLDYILNSYILKNPLSLYEIKEQKLSVALENLQLNIKNVLKNKTHNFELLNSKLQILNPLAILNKGYSVVFKDGEIIKDTKKIKIGDEIKIRFSKGNLKAEVKEKE